MCGSSTDAAGGYSPREQQCVRAALASFETWRVEFHDVLESTQDRCRELAAAGEREHAVVVASHQTRGRGTRGRTWVASPHADVTFSVLLEPAGRYPDALLPFVFGAAVYEAVRARTDPGVSIKWPNDVLAGGRKVAGILLEGQPGGHWIGGVGANVGATRFPNGLQETATSLALLERARPERAEVLADLLARLAGLLVEPESRGTAGPCIDVFARGLGLVGREVVVDGAQGRSRGLLHGLDPTGIVVGDERVPVGLVHGIRPSER